MTTQGTLKLWTDSPPVLLTIKQAAAALSLGRSTIYELIGAGEIEVVHIGRSARVPIDAINEFVYRLRSREGASRPG